MWIDLHAREIDPEPKPRHPQHDPRAREQHAAAPHARIGIGNGENRKPTAITAGTRAGTCDSSRHPFAQTSTAPSRATRVRNNPTVCTPIHSGLVPSTGYRHEEAGN